MISYNADIIRYATAVHTLPSASDLNRLSRFTIKNPLCGDDIIWYYQVEGEQIKKLYYLANACLICKAATNICYSQFESSNLQQLRNFIQKYRLIADMPIFENELGCFSELQSYPNRQKCVTLPYVGLNNCLLKLE